MTKLKNLRVASGMTQKEFAEKAGANVRMVQHFEQGQKPIDKARLETLLQYALALDCSVADLLETDEMVELMKKYESGRK